MFLTTLVSTFISYQWSKITVNLKYSDTQKMCCNHSKIWTLWLYHRVMSPNKSQNDADGAVYFESALFAQAYLSENLGSLWYTSVCV